MEEIRTKVSFHGHGWSHLLVDMWWWWFLGFGMLVLECVPCFVDVFCDAGAHACDLVCVASLVGQWLRCWVDGDRCVGLWWRQVL